MNGTMLGTTTTTTRRPRFDRLAFAAVAFVALLALAVVVGNALAAGTVSVLLGAFALAVGVAVVTALPFVLVRAMSEVAFR
ncbi:hypothetical protein [Halomarina salina]|nr:hypothetical protein [Halomarina salina]